MTPLRWSLWLALVAATATSACQDDATSAHANERGDEPVAAQQRVRTVVVRRAPLDARRNVSGLVRAFHKASVTAEATGRVIGRTVERGQSVEAGAALVELDPTRFALALRRAEATLRARKNDRAHAQREFDRGEQLVSNDAISAQRRDDLRHALDRARDEYELARVARDTARRDLADATIAAPFSARRRSSWMRRALLCSGDAQKRSHWRCARCSASDCSYWVTMSPRPVPR